jgi:hypothetical protein
MTRQVRISRNLGRDTFVRSYQGNGFKQQGSKTYQTVGGEILISQPEPLFRQTVVTVGLARGGKITSVAYPGAFFDPITGNLHGSYEGPIPGQMVIVGFENGNAGAPYVVNRYPYQGKGNTLTEAKYINPVTRALFDSTDVITGHFSGSYLAFYTGILSGEIPGSVKINAMTDFNAKAKANILLDALLSAEVKSIAVKLTGSSTVDLKALTATIEGTTKVEVKTALAKITASTQIELNGNGNWAIKFTEMQTAFNQLKTDLNTFITAFNTHTHLYAPGPSAPAPTAPPAAPGVASAADMTTAKNVKVLM